MNLHPASIFLLFLCFLNTFSAATGDVSVNCGSSGVSAARSGKEWHGDIQPKFSSLIQLKGSSAAATVAHKSISADDPVPYRTARLSRSQFSYAFQVNPGQKILRLHFNPAPYKGFKKFKDLFDVEAGPFTLLSNFSASLTAYALGVNSFAKEFCINIQDNQQLNIVFSPASSQSLRTYTFINGIEIVSVPATLSYFQGKYIGVQVVGKSLVNVDNSTALEIIRRLNLKQDSVSSSGDIDDMFGMWETVPKRKESKMRSITWKTSVDVGFRYLVRLHFSELGLKMAEFSGITFKVCINDMIVDTNIDISRERDDEDIIPWYRDYMVVIMKGHKHEGKRDLLICLQSNGEFMDGHGLLKGFEIMKLSNSDNSLASPNPFPSTQDSSYRIIQNLHHVLGHRNMIATVAIALLALVNIIIYILRQIWEASCTEEENMPLVRAERLCRRFSLAEIQLATRNFSDAHLIGKGGFGKVYRGLIDNGRETVAIKRLKSNSNQGVREFLTEIETLTELRHVNLVSLIGYCNEYGEMVLVYEYMECGTLADHLYKLSRKSDNCSSLTWEQRLNICIGAGRGLDYLHTGHALIHRDVKPSNILLDENFIAKVSDFGLAKHLSRSTLQSHVSTKVKGTYGYLDPNYFTTGKLTRKSDTFSFGVVLLEVLSGRPAVDPWVAEDERMLTKWARENISKGKAGQIVASNLRGGISEDSLKAFVGVAERCLHDEPKERPTMAEVVLQLVSALKQQERESSKSTAPKGITSDVDDIHSSNNESNSSVSTQQLTMASTDVQNLTPPQTNSKGVNTKPPSERKDWTKATTHKPSRLWTWDAFWSRIIPSGKNKHIREMSLRRRDLEQWMSHRCLPEELKRQIWEAERVNWVTTRGINEEMLMENLPEDLQRDIRRYLFNSFKKVRIFQFLDEHVIDAICERLRAKTYIKGSKIFYHGGLVDKMVCITRGKMESIGEDLVVPLSEGDVCGEELLTWCLEQSSVNKDGLIIRIPGYRLLSNRLVRCLTNVEAFVLRAADLEEVTNLFARFLRSPRVQGAIRYESPNWRGLAARRIQVAWRYRKKRQSRTGSSSPPHAYSS